MYPNSALSAWQLAVIAVVAVTALAIWLTAVFLAAREPRGRAQAAAGSGSGSPALPPAGEREPEHPAAA